VRILGLRQCFEWPWLFWLCIFVQFTVGVVTAFDCVTASCFRGFPLRLKLSLSHFILLQIASNQLNAFMGPLDNKVSHAFRRLTVHKLNTVLVLEFLDISMLQLTSRPYYQFYTNWCSTERLDRFWLTQFHKQQLPEVVSSGIKRQWRETSRCPPYTRTAEVNAWSCTFFPQYVFIALYLID
jgi:hypothetical protein